jgi:hypothetical protein
MLQKTGMEATLVQVDRYTADTCTYKSFAFADLTVHAYGFGTAASMINDIHGFVGTDGEQLQANVRLKPVLVCHLPVMLVIAMEDIHLGDRLLLDYGWDVADGAFDVDRAKVEACVSDVRQAMHAHKRTRRHLLERGMAEEDVDAASLAGQDPSGTVPYS